MKDSKEIKMVLHVIVVAMCLIKLLFTPLGARDSFYEV